MPAMPTYQINRKGWVSVNGIRAGATKNTSTSIGSETTAQIESILVRLYCVSVSVENCVP
jgi:hypothetical protein